MENGGNAKVNAIFEQKLAASGVAKPTNHADLQLRERYIRDKYERRKFYDPIGFQQYAEQCDKTATAHHFEADFASANVSAPVIGNPSDIARQRAETRGLPRSNSNVSAKKTVRRTKSSERDPHRWPVQAAPASAPVIVDLLDLMSDPAPPLHNGAAATTSHDLFSVPASASNDSNFDLLGSPEAYAKPRGGKRGDESGVKTPPRRGVGRTRSAEKLPIKKPSPMPVKKASVSDDILSLYNTAAPNLHQAASLGGGNVTQMMGNMNMNGNRNSINNTMQQQQPQMMMNAQLQMQLANLTPQQRQALLLQYQQQQQMIMYQQQQMMMQQQQQQQSKPKVAKPKEKPDPFAQFSIKNGQDDDSMFSTEFSVNDFK
jgi:hypothetical protein